MRSYSHFWFAVYNVIAVPLMYVGAYLARFFNSKIKRGIQERRGLFRRLKEIRDALSEGKRVIVIHCASAGEFEASRPLLSAIHARFPDLWIHVTCYSPSGIKPISKAAEVNSYSYLPFDNFISAHRFFSILNPAVFLFIKHDIWPNMVWTASRRGVPCLWVNANLHEKSRRLTWVGRGFNRSFLRTLSAVLTVSDAHAIRLSSLVSPLQIEVTGDSRYDRTKERMTQTLKMPVEPLDERWFEGKKVIVAGSTWGPDQRILVPAYAALKKDFPELYLILVPHEPNEHFLSETTFYLRGYDLNPIRLSQVNGALPPADVLVVDRVGILAILYRFGWTAYVGGAFGEGVHSVLEPAVYKLPIFFGPKYYMACEAKLLVQRGAARVVSSAKELEDVLRLYLKDPEAIRQAAEQSGKVIEKGLGATERMVTQLSRYLSQQDIP